MAITLNLIALILTIATVSFGANFPIDNDNIGHSRADVNPEDYILSDEIVVPTKYNILIKPDFEKLDIDGNVEITIDVKQGTKEIVLHRGDKITFEEADVKITQEGTDQIAVTKVDYKSENNFCTITLDKDLTVGEAKLEIKYTGKILEGTAGFYLAKYTDETGKEKLFGTTQFESTSARDAFPCFDQPDMKALFTIRINRPKGYNSASNMKLKGTPTADGEDREIDEFEETTVRMPTYLIAFVVSELKATTGDDAYKVYGVPHLIDDGRGKYGVDSGKEIIKKMEEFVQVKYSLNKLDQVAIPDEYFSAGAMENWGLVTYKQKYLLQKDGVTTASEKQNILSIIAHEFAHQWFGNLVTPKWWDSLWLSEGFATYFEHYATELVDPSMKMADQFITLTNQLALESDAADDTRAMNAKVYTQKDISNFFDRIAYQKSGAVIRMMEHIVTTDIFKLGLKNYLEAMTESGSVVPTNLWAGIQSAVDTLSEDKKKEYGLDTRKVADIMETWNGNVGYPVVYAERNDEGLISLSQDRFLYSKSPSGESTVWAIPINFARGDEIDFTSTKTDFWLEADKAETELKIPLENWFILNKQQTGFYRVNYDATNWDLIINYLDSDDFNKIPVLNRAQLIDDSFNLARAKRINYDIPLRLSRYLTRETEYIPLATFLKSASFLNNYLISTEHYDNFKPFVIESLKTAYETLKIADSTNHVEKLNRAQLISWMCRFEEENCTNDVHEKLLELQSKTESALPDLQNPYYCGGMRKADDIKTKFEYLLERYENESVEYLERARIVSGLGCSLNEEYLTHLLKFAIGKNPDEYKDFVLHDVDKQTAFSAVYSSSEIGLKTALNFVADNFADVKTTFKDTVVKSIIGGIATRTSLKEHADILEKIEDADFKSVLEEAIKTITTNNEWATNNLGDVQTWLGDTYGSAGFVTVSFTLLLSMLVVLNRGFVINGGKKFDFSSVLIFGVYRLISKKMGALFNSLLLTIFALLIQKGNCLPTNSNLTKTTLNTRAGPEYFLPTKAEPINYKIDLVVNDDFADTKSFTGIAEIRVKILEKTNIITLHAEELDFSENTPTETGYEIQYLNNYDMITLTFNNEIDVTDEFVIKDLKFKGKLRTEDMYGFYLSSYTLDDEQKTEEFVATTQFQPTHARKVFPCFDEPKYKASFDFTITRSKNFMALFNTKKIDTISIATDLEKDVFQTTPKMSTYLIAFIVSKFKGYGQTVTGSDNLIYDVFCREDALPTAKYAYYIGPQILDVLNDYTNFKYYSMENTDKMHQVAIPDFSAGAMENWGLVTYRETALLWDPEESTTSYKSRVATVIAHEFAHMWFGDLVTLQWWQYTWLNEGFARYLQYYITKEVETTWELEKLFVIEQQQVIFVSDAISNAFALNSEAYTPNEVSAKFGSISYSKGGSIIRMMNHFMGEENFKKGIQDYLKTNEYSNTVPKNLWDKLQLHAANLPTGKTLEQVMENWTEKSGFPVVTVTLERNDAVLTQERFLYGKTENDENTKWYIPITYTTSHEKVFEDNEIMWMIPDNNYTITNILHGGTGWVLVNINENGYYRVNYDDILWDQLEIGLKKENFDGIKVINRAQVVDDVFNLARAGIVSYERALDVTSYLSEETEYFPWYSALSAFSYLRRRRGESEYLESHIRELMAKLYDSVSFDISNNDDFITILKTALALDWSCNLGVESCVSKAKELFKDYKENGIKIDPNLRSTVYCTALRNSDDIESDWNFLWEKFTSTSLATEQVTILSALGCTTDQDILNDYLKKSITVGSPIRKQDARSVFTAVLTGNLNGVNVAYEFFTANLEDLSSYYSGMNDLTNIISSMTDRFTTQEQIDNFSEFAEANKELLKEGYQQVQSSLTNAAANINWAQKELDDWLNAKYNSAVAITINLSLLGVILTVLFVL
nr:uncharacterized protein LOC111428220 [Onthophagus taurus]